MSIFGAIRWDAWYQPTPSTASSGAQAGFSQANMQSRAPWFAQVASPYVLTCTGTQANMDIECQMAHDAGVDFWAFDCYQPGNPFAFAAPDLSQAWNLYQGSPNKNLVKWCWITFGWHWSSATFSDNSWQPFLATIANTHCTQANYQKVLGNRPLVFCFTNPTNTANMATAVAYFRAQCTGAGLGTPYMVLQLDTTVTAAANAATVTACGYDAVSNYALPFLVALNSYPASYDTLDTSMQAKWAAQAAAGKVVPTGACGWDTRIINRAPVANATRYPWFNDLNYWSNPTPTRSAQHVQSLMNFVTANATACDAQAALMYSWTECTEGSVRALIPTLGDPPVSGSTQLLTAIKGVLRP